MAKAVAFALGVSWAAMLGAQGIAAEPPCGARRPETDAQLRFWLHNMVVEHGFSRDETMAATGLTAEETAVALKRFGFSGSAGRGAISRGRFRVLPYPGGRHPRIGFLDGAVCPQRETKLSVFPGWKDGGYVVVDVPEAIWCQEGLLYLAHTHVPTIWTRQNVTLPVLEWTVKRDGSYEIDRRLPDGVRFGARAVPGRKSLRMTLWLENGSARPLSDLRVQNCVMLKAARGFERQTNENKRLLPPYAAVVADDGRHWVITAWSPAHRTWANPPVPCMHSDPKFPDCPPGERRTLEGWLSFYEGDSVEGEIRRIESTGWRGAER